MNTDRHITAFSCVWFAVRAVGLSLLAIAASHAQSEGTVYFLAAGPRHSQSQPGPQAAEYESFVVPVGDPEKIAQIRSLIRRAEYPVVKVRIKASGDGMNRDFYAPAAPAWNWSVTELIDVQGEPASIFLPCCPGPGELPEDEYGSVSMIAADPAAWVTKHGDVLNQQWFPLTTEVNPSRPPMPPDPEMPVMANLSTRAIAAKGQDIFIGGTAVIGSRPKQLAIRCSGITLLQRQGLLTGMNPRVRVIAADGTQLSDMQATRDYEIKARFPALHQRGIEVLSIVTLYPGQYTFHVYDPSGTTGLVLFELYDLSFAPQPFP